MKSSADLPTELAPVLAFEDSYPARYVDAPHSHPYSQLAFATSGVISVAVADATYILPPNRAVWIPAHARHQTSCRSEVQFLALYVDPRFDQLKTTRVFEISPLVRALIDEVAAFTSRREFGEREEAVVRLLLGDLERLPQLPACVSLPTDRRLRRVCEAIIADPADNRAIDDWAGIAGMGRRTFTRAFREQTGMSLAMWRRQVRVAEAASRIAAGETIHAVSFKVGYESPSAFIAMFHRAFGAPPGAYCRR